MFNVNTIMDGISEETRRKTKEVVERLREVSIKFVRFWTDNPPPLWLSVAIEEHNARIATYDYMLTVLDVGEGFARGSRFVPEYEDEVRLEHYEGAQYLNNCSIEVVLAFVQAYISSGHNVEIEVLPESEYFYTDKISAYKIKYKK